MDMIKIYATNHAALPQNKEERMAHASFVLIRPFNEDTDRLGVSMSIAQMLNDRKIDPTHLWYDDSVECCNTMGELEVTLTGGEMQIDSTGGLNEQNVYTDIMRFLERGAGLTHVVIADPPVIDAILNRSSHSRKNWLSSPGDLALVSVDEYGRHSGEIELLSPTRGDAGYQAA